jgi:hypothetical protein
VSREQADWELVDAGCAPRSDAGTGVHDREPGKQTRQEAKTDLSDGPVHHVHLLIDRWDPLHGTYALDGTEQPEREFHGWIGLAAGLTALEHETALELEGEAPSAEPV